MSIREVRHRIVEFFKKKAAKFVRPSPFEGPAPTLTSLAFCKEQFEQLATADAVYWRREVDRAKGGGWHFLGYEWPFVALNDTWHFDPITRKDWPRGSYCFDINYRHNHKFGDVKYVWEVNRLQIVPLAAALWRYEGRDDDRDFAIAILDSWMTANPPFKGVNWASGIELALRSLNIIVAMSLLGEEAIEGIRGRLLRNLEVHLYWLRRFPSRFSSANNHLIAELSASYILARLMPSVRNAALIASESWEELMAEVLKQIHPDGVGAEQSPTYTAFTIEWSLWAIAVARQFGETIPDEVRVRLTKAGAALRWLMDDSGQVPRIGDDDEGRVLLSGAAREHDYVALILTSLASTLNKPSIAPPKDRSHLRQLWLGRSSEKSVAPKGTKHFDFGGYTVMRHDIAGHRSVMVLDHGPLGYLSIAAHGHADALAVWWHLNQQPIWIDAGTYLYHSGAEERDRFRSTEFHNTLCLNGLNQSKISGPFNWSNKAQSQRIPLGNKEGQERVLAMHNGYKNEGLVHYRQITFDRNQGYTIVDWLEGEVPKLVCDAAIRFLLAPEIEAVPTKDGLILCRKRVPFARLKACLAQRGDENIKAMRTSVEYQIINTQYSPSFGKKEPTKALRLSISAENLVSTCLQTRIELLAGESDAGNC